MLRKFLPVFVLLCLMASCGKTQQQPDAAAVSVAAKPDSSTPGAAQKVATTADPGRATVGTDVSTPALAPDAPSAKEDAGPQPDVVDAAAGNDAAADAAADTAAAGDAAATLSLVRPDEIAKVTADVLAAVAASRKRKCSRPVLRGEATPGSGTKLLGDLLSPQGPCGKLVNKNKGSIRNAVLAGKSTSPDGFPKRRLRDLVALDTAVPKPMATIVESCTLAVATAKKALQHAEVCAPFRPGIRPPPPLTPMVTLGEVIALKARQLWQAGDVNAAFELLADLLQWSQDMGRGGAALAPALMGHRAGWPAALTLEAILNHQRKLDDASLASLDKDLSRLAANYVDFHDPLAADSLEEALYLNLPLMHGPAWKPPGGFATGYLKPTAEDIAVVTGDTPKDAGIVLVVSHEAKHPLAGTCPRGVSISACLQALGVAEKRLEKDAGDIDEESLAKLAKLLGTEPVEVIRKRLLLAYRAGIWSLFSAYGREWGQGLFRLGALRLHVALRRRFAKDKRCPTTATLKSVDRSLTLDPVSGQPFKVKDLGKGRLLIQPSISLKRWSDVSYRIECPKRSKKR